MARPGLLHQVSIGLCNLTLHAQWVAEVELLQIAVFEEVLGELWHVAEALQRAEPGERGEEEEGQVTRSEEEGKREKGQGETKVQGQGRENSSILGEGRTW